MSADPFEFARLTARRIAITEGVPMVIGWQQNDVTGDDEPGWCPASVVGPCFVHTVVERFEPPRGQR